MSEARLRILRLLGVGRISDTEADLLLQALAEGYPGDRPSSSGISPAPVDGAVTASQAAATGPVDPGSPTFPSPQTPTLHVEPAESESGSGTGEVAETEDLISVESEDWEDLDPPRAPSRGAEVEEPEHGPDYLPLSSISVSPQTVVRITAASTPSRQAEESGLAVAVRGIETNRITTVRGDGVSSRWSGDELEIAWTSGLLLLEIPSRLGGLAFESLAGSVGLSGYAGPFTVDGLDGPLTVHGPRAPFRIRNVRGLVQILALALHDGVSTIAQSDGDVEIEAADEASVSIRAVSTEGGVNLGDSPGEGGAAGLRRRGVWRLGAGTGQLNISTIRGKISVRRSPASGKGERT